MDTQNNDKTKASIDVNDELEEEIPQEEEPSPTPKPEDDDDDDTESTGSSEDENDIEDLKLELNKRKLSLQSKLKSSLKMRLKIQEQLNEIQEQLDLLNLSLLTPSEKTIKPVIPSELIAAPTLDTPGKEVNFKGTARRGAMTKKEKELWQRWQRF